MYSRKKKSVDEIWLRKRYMEDFASTEIIAEEAGCSRALIQKIVSANKDEEHVHHIDFDVKNNEPSNLLVLGAGVHRLLHVAIHASGDCSKEFQLGWLVDSRYEYVFGGEV